MEQCTPCLYIRDREVKPLFYADDLVLLSAVGQEIQQTADHQRKKINYIYGVSFQKRFKCQENRYQFSINKLHLPCYHHNSIRKRQYDSECIKRKVSLQ